MVRLIGHACHSSDLGGKGRRVKVQGQPGQLSSMVELPHVQSSEPQKNKRSPETQQAC